MFEFVPQKLVYGGDAFGHHGGHVVLAPRSLPGERVEVEEVRKAKGVLHVRPVRILEAAPDRVTPPCPYFGRCGGCQYQHLSPENQTLAKREILRETLRRIGKIHWIQDIPAHAAQPWNYRNQAQFKVVVQEDGRAALGFFEAESHVLAPIETCPILSPLLNKILEALRQPQWSVWLGGFREIELLADHRDERAMLTFHGIVSKEDGDALAADCLARLPGVACVTLDGGRHDRLFGEGHLFYQVGEFNHRVSPGSFFQASRFLLPQLVPAAIAGHSGDVALDLFAGVGLFTLPLARQFKEVVGVEAFAPAANDLAANADAYGLKNVRAVGETAFNFLRRYARTAPDLVLIDPPRAGVGAPTLKLLAALRPRRVHYVSCHPPTLARDLGSLAALGYALESIELFDFFPQTYHIESVAKLAPMHK